jgi:hypothetical protein
LYLQAQTTALQGWERGTPYIWSTMPGAPAAAAPVAAHCLGGLAAQRAVALRTALNRLRIAHRMRGAK